MKIVVTGASGFLGRYLVKEFGTRGAQLLLVGRDLAKLNKLFPAIDCCSYDDLAVMGAGYDAIIHLATKNNNVEAPLDSFMRVNVDLALDVARAAQTAGIKRFVNVSTIHAFKVGKISAYAQSKRAAAERIALVLGPSVHTLYFPAIIGDQTEGAFGLLNKLPSGLRHSSVLLLAAIKPILVASDAAAACWDAATLSTAPAQLIVTANQAKNPVYGFFKRTTDLIAALAILFLLWWLMALIWIAVRLQSPGPAIFSQHRVGKSGRVFVCYKFRTMFQGAPNVGTHEAPASLVTPVGGFLRRTKLDELPQIVNILRNEMSLVGPRPCLPSQLDVIRARQRRGVLDILPGITGLAQVNHVDMSQPETLAEWDWRYLKLRSLALEMSILISTALGRGNGDLIKNKREENP